MKKETTPVSQQKWRFGHEHRDLGEPLTSMDPVMNLTDDFLETLHNFYSGVQEGFLFRCHMEKFEPLLDLNVDERKKKHWDQRVEYSFGKRLTSVKFSNNWLTDTEITGIHDSVFVGYRHFIVFELDRQYLKLSCVKFCRLLIEPRSDYASVRQYDLSGYSDKEKLFKYFRECLTDYITAEDVKNFFKDQKYYILAVSIANIVEKTGDLQMNEITKSKETSFNYDCHRRDIGKLFVDMVNQIKLEKPIEFYAIINTNINRFISSYLIYHAERERRFRVDAGIDFVNDLSVTRYLKKVRPLHITPMSFGEYGCDEMLDEWKYVKSLALKEEIEFLQSNSFIRAEPLKYMALPTRMPDLMAHRIMSTETFKNVYGDAFVLRMTFDEFKAFTDEKCKNKYNLLKPEVFEELKDDIQKYGKFLIRRSAIIIATILMLSIEDYYLVELQARRKELATRRRREELNDPMPMNVRVVHGHDKYLELYRMKTQLMHFAGFIPTKFYEQEYLDKEVPEIKVLLETHPEIERAGACAYSMYRKLEIEKKLEEERKEAEKKAKRAYW